MIATRSAGKLREMTPILASWGIEAITLDDVELPAHPDEEHIERFATFEANARAKADYFAARLPGHVMIADDSGLEVDALGGRPGVRSKRWSGRHDLDGTALDVANNAFLLAALDGVDANTESRRVARYVCAMACARAGDAASRHVVRGACEGRILHAPAGTSGFGYDPLFWSADLARAFGQCTREEKAVVSHRARALRALEHQLARMLPG